MLKVGLLEARQKLSELIEQAARGERIGFTSRGKLAAVIGPAGATVNLHEFSGHRGYSQAPHKEGRERETTNC